MGVERKRIDRGKAHILRQMKEHLVAKVGFPHEKNPVHEEARIRVAELALTHEYGSEKRNIPARPFMRETGKRERKTAKRLMVILLRLELQGGINRRQLLGRMGVWYASEMKETIVAHSHKFKPLSRATIARKGSTTPLLDTAGMKNAITSVVTKDTEVSK